MADRLKDLLRQRALIQEHLVWIDREISEATQAAPRGDSTGATAALPQSLPNLPLPTRNLGPAPLTAQPAAANPEDDAALVLSQYQQDASSLKGDARRGCLLYFGVGMFLIFAITFGVYLLYITYRK